METTFAHDPVLQSDAAGSFAGDKRGSKAVSAYRTISETADLLGVPQHVLRFWETKFPQIRPMKRSGGRRYYGPGDIETLRTIQNFLYEQGYTIKGVQRLLRLRRGTGGLALPMGTLDDAVLNDELFDTDAVAEALMLNAPAPSMDMIKFGGSADVPSDTPSEIEADVTPALDVVISTLDDLAELDIPSHLPAKPAALMAAGIEAGRPYPQGTMMAMPYMDQAPQAEPALHLSPAKRQRLEALLGELKLLKTLL